jgi:hypothetical protein
VSVSSLSARPSPVNRRVGIHNFTFGACSSFTRVTACKIARPPEGGLFSRGFDPISYPTEPLDSYHVLPTTTWVDPPSTGDLRRWGALLTSGGRAPSVLPETLERERYDSEDGTWLATADFFLVPECPLLTMAPVHGGQ